MKKRMFFLLLPLLLLVGCDPVQDDLISYLNDGIMPLVDLEEEVIAIYESVTGDNYYDDWILYEAIELEIIPKYQNLINQLEAVRPETPEVREVHEIYIKGTNIQYNAMVLMLDALDYQDYALIAEANNMLAEGRATLRQYQNEVERLADKHNVIFE
ncbi:hypothetical protein [Bacillus alkalicellulosilyticus]|uniref:hypothetical protein n=1 Tax=Alkalihalobacterium alkalicellulosilyticum TaxID=1912214 RepID=UPI000997E84B|nr:hypothetical protein [Bacillus alkalicellulosilyticus]